MLMPEAPAGLTAMHKDDEVSCTAYCAVSVTQRPKILTSDTVKASDIVITMGCGDACPFFPGKRYLDWQLDDPAGQGLDAVRPIRNEIRRRIEKLITELRSSG
jgi:protein-tyrosine-phosphatase